MSYTNEPILADTVIATAAVARNRFVTLAGAMAGAGALVYGVSSYDAAIGDAFAANIAGHLSVEAGAAVAVGQRVKSDATGRAIPAADNEAAAAMAVRAAAGAGQPLRILRLSLTC
ncbi:MAG: DUF2190 family protein [Rhodoblastus sp.]